MMTNGSSMYREFAGKVIGADASDPGDPMTPHSLLVEHNGLKFLVVVWAFNGPHAKLRLADHAASRWFYRVIDVCRQPTPEELSELSEFSAER